MRDHRTLVLGILVVLVAAANPSCGCGLYLKIAPSDAKPRCRVDVSVSSHSAHQMVAGEERTYDIFHSTDTGGRKAVPIDSVEPSNPKIFEVASLENPDDGFPTTTLRAKTPGEATLKIVSDDGDEGREALDVVESSDDLVRPGSEDCIGRPADAGLDTKADR